MSPEPLQLQQNNRARKFHNTSEFKFQLLLAKLCYQLEQHELKQ